MPPDWFTTALESTPAAGFVGVDGAEIHHLRWGEAGAAGRRRRTPLRLTAELSRVRRSG